MSFLRQAARAGAAALLAVGQAGCSFLPTTIEGNLPSRDEGIVSTRSRVLHATDTGEVEIRPPMIAEGKPQQNRSEGAIPVSLPSASEPKRFGVTFADASALPRPLRPVSSPEGGVIVTALKKASPLAIAGLRPFDVVRKINDIFVSDPSSAVRALERVKDGEEVTLARETSWQGRPKTIKVRVDGPLFAETEVYVPFTLQVRTGQTASALGLGPLDSIFTFRDVLEASDTHGGLMPVSYSRETTWGALLGLVNYSSTTELDDGSRRSRLRVLWFIPIFSRP